MDGRAVHSPLSRPLTDYNKVELIELVDQLLAGLLAQQEELDAVDEQLAILRCCADHHCMLCSRCVTALFVKAHPRPLTLPQKYVSTGPWRK